MANLASSLTFSTFKIINVLLNTTYYVIDHPVTINTKPNLTTKEEVKVNDRKGNLCLNTLECYKKEWSYDFREIHGCVPIGTRV